MANPFANVSFKDLSRVAAYLGDELCSEYDKQFPNKYQRNFDCDVSARTTLSFVIWKVLCELKEFGELKTHPKDLLRRAVYLMRHYEYRDYNHFTLEWLCRAFTRQFSHFEDLPPKKDFPICWIPWKFYGFYDVQEIKTSDQATRRIFVTECSTLKSFGNFFVCEEYPVEFTKIAGLGGIIVDKWRCVTMIPFESRDEAALFIVQLADLLNTDDAPDYEPDNPFAAQYIRDVVAQAPVEQMQVELERKAAEEAQQAEKERQIMLHGTHVYILDFGNGLVKIGISNNVRSRISQAKTFGQITVKFAVTEKGFSLDKALRIESDCHYFFRDKRVTKEVFRVPYEDAKAYLESHALVLEFDEGISQ